HQRQSYQWQRYGVVAELGHFPLMDCVARQCGHHHLRRHCGDSQCRHGGRAYLSHHHHWLHLLVMADLYDTLEDALYYAAQGVYDADRNTTEHMSLLYRMPDGRYGITAPAGEGNKKGVKQKITYPAEAAIAALMHNHP